MKKVSIVIPVYFNENNVSVTYEALMAEINKFKNAYDYEIIFVDDGSEDNSLEELKKIYKKDPDHIHIIKLSRNFGQVVALQAGFKLASGDAAIVISADLQDPPELIHKFLHEWDTNDHEIVIAARTEREDDFISKVTSKIFYGLMRKYALKTIPKGGFDYFLISKKVLGVINSMDEKNTFLQGQILWTGFTPKIIPYARSQRSIGESKWTFSKKIKYFIDGFMTYSYYPIRFISVFGIITAFIGFLYAVLIIVLKITVGLPIKGWAPIMVIILLLSGLQMIMLGIIGEYLWRNYDEARKRPLFTIDKIISRSKNVDIATNIL